jgi:hypothetical protein
LPTPSDSQRVARFEVEFSTGTTLIATGYEATTLVQVVEALRRLG